MSEIPAPAAISTPPASLVGAFEPEVVARVLGPKPDPWPGLWTSRAEDAREWRSDYPGQEYFHRGVVRLLWEHGRNAEAADAIQRGLELGDIRAVVIDDDDGEAHLIPPQRWRAAKGREEMYWTGRATIDGHSGYIYLLPTDEFSAALVLPTPAQTLAGATQTAAEREAERQVETTGITDPEATPQPANIKPAELGPRERTTVYKMLFAAVIEAYGYRPNTRSDAASQLGAATERLWPGGGVSDRAIRDWLKAAVEELGDPTTNKP
jgi:hypothetical protein